MMLLAIESSCIEEEFFRFSLAIDSQRLEIVSRDTQCLCESDFGLHHDATYSGRSPDNHQRFGRTGACRRRQSIARSTSKRAMLSTATAEVPSTEGLKPLPRQHDSGTTPTMMISEGA